MTYTVCCICHEPMEENSKNTCSSDCQRLKNNKASRLKNFKNKICGKIVKHKSINPKWLKRGLITACGRANSFNIGD